MTRKILWLTLIALGSVWTGLAQSVQGAGLGAPDAIPHINAEGQKGYQAFAAAQIPRAFAIAPGGVWAWVSGSATEEVAEAEALKACRQYTTQPCQLFAVNDQVVFDQATWTASWDLHLDVATAAEAAVGIGRGQRFPNLALTSSDGDPVTLSDMRGKPVFLHFWGSWCPPCQTEFADLQKLYDTLEDDNAVTFVLVQARESIAKSQRWASKRKFTMPLYDSGHQGRGDKTFRLANGGVLPDRRLASTYPTTYVLDANGLVVFHQAGPGEQWKQYEKLLRHISTNATR